MTDEKILSVLTRIAVALEHQNDVAHFEPIDWQASRSYVWHAESGVMKPVLNPSVLPLTLLKGIERNADILMANTAKFASGRPANNALLWGARGTGKSSIVKSVHHSLSNQYPLYLIEIYREDLGSLPYLLDILKQEENKRFILFCDDLSFDAHETSYKSLKAVLEGGVEQKPENVIFYATSNRRHLMPRDMIENEQQNGIHPGEAVQEKVSLSDRFGLWLGFHPCNQDVYLNMIDSYAEYYEIKTPQKELHRSALEWAMTRGSRSGRVASQFIQNIRT